MNLSLYLRTLSYLKPKQAAYFIWRRLLPEWKMPIEDEVVHISEDVRMDESITACSSVSDEREFRFLNQSRLFDLSRMDWASSDMTRLWRYNLQYFDYVNDRIRSKEDITVLINDWIAHNPPGSKDAWEPYTISLRVVNWIKLFLRPEYRGEVSDAWLQSLYRQACWLENNIEYHILANHYLKNGKALLFAGMFFDGMRAARWRKLGLKILREEAQEQILADGGHFERSPMYHAIVVEDYLDVLNLIYSSDSALDSNLTILFRTKLVAALDFLHDISMPDGDIPLFNDSAFGIASPTGRLFEYAKRVIGYLPEPHSTELFVRAKNATGYYVIRHAGDALVADCGPVGPDYQPGHAHCDTLSYELSLDGRRVIVDSGVHDYEDSAERRFARSTRAHNTVVVDGHEQSEVWGVFRVARRAYPIDAKLVKTGESKARFEGAHDGYRRLPGKVVHRRSIEYDVKEGWTVHDMLLGGGHHALQSFLHVHPDFVASVKDLSIDVSEVGGKSIATILVDGAAIEVEQGWYFPEFGIQVENAVIVLSCSGMLPLHITYRIKKA